MQPFRETKWSSDRVRRIIQQHSERLLGRKVSTSSWRQIAIAISNRYLGTKHDPSYHGENGEDEDGIDDAGVSDARDLMAGHTSHVAGMIYAREMQQGLGGTAMMREKFREVSREWHQFFDFGQGSISQGVQGEATGAAQQRRQRNKFESSRQAVRLRRLEALRQVDIAFMLQAIKGKAATFRPQQRTIISAIVRGESPVIQITPTGGGKSMSFMLPAYCSKQGRTIVIVPLVALQEDIHNECIQHGIEASIWNSKTGVHQGSRVILVITEAVFTAAFRHFIQRLQSQFAIDRVVVDECHTMLDGSDAFRPALRDIGQEIALWGVQRIFLTATLRPSEEKEFFQRAHVHKETVVMFRGNTTRRNIQYRVVLAKGPAGARDAYNAQQEAENDKAMETAQGWVQEHEEGRVIIYASTVPRTKALAEALGVDAYFNKAGSREEKRRRMRSWMTTKRLIVATNALGLGINVPDVRLVIHVGLPYKVRAFAQESGRLGRDGKPGTSIIVCKGMQGQQGFIPQGDSVRDEEMVEYIRGIRCRRYVLDKAMDGRIREGGCQDDEAMCDVCVEGGNVQEHNVMAIRHIVSRKETAHSIPDDTRRGMDANKIDHTIEEGEREKKRRRVEDTSAERMVALRRAPSADRESWSSDGPDRKAPMENGIKRMEDEDGHNTNMAIYMQEREQEFAIWKESEKIRDHSLLTAIFERQLADWSDGCVHCRIAGGDHAHDGRCPLQRGHTRVYDEIEEHIRHVREWMGRPGSFARYCGCWECGLPYRICDRWEDIYGDGGKFRRVAGGQCQYPDIMAKVMGAGLVHASDIIAYIFKQIGGVEDGRELQVEEMLRIGGRRRKSWGGMETNEMCVGMSMLMDWFDEDV